MASAAAAEPDSQVKLGHPEAQLLALEWGSFIGSVAVRSGIVSLGLSFWAYVVKISDHLYSPFYSMKVMFCS